MFNSYKNYFSYKTSLTMSIILNANTIIIILEAIKNKLFTKQDLDKIMKTFDVNVDVVFSIFDSDREELYSVCKYLTGHAALTKDTALEYLNTYCLDSNIINYLLDGTTYSNPSGDWVITIDHQGVFSNVIESTSHFYVSKSGSITRTVKGTETNIVYQGYEDNKPNIALNCDTIKERTVFCSLNDNYVNIYNLDKYVSVSSDALTVRCFRHGVESDVTTELLAATYKALGADCDKSPYTKVLTKDYTLGKAVVIPLVDNTVVATPIGTAFVSKKQFLSC